MKQLHIVQLYINEMNTYGDRGNLLTLAKRMQRHGYEPVIHYYHLHGELPDKVDIVLGGGGQDAAQADIEMDIQRIGGRLHKLADEGVPMLMVCGTYQLFGHRFLTHTGTDMQGIGIFDLETRASDKRLIGNVAVESDFGTLYGFENHSGRTFLNKGQAALGKVLRGAGNNGEDHLEGARTNNVIGCYLHGPVLPNNPALTDGLIELAAFKAHGSFERKPIDDSLAEAARRAAADRRY